MRTEVQKDWPVVLVVDDDKNFRRYVRTESELLGRPFETMTTEDSLLQRLKKQRQDHFVIFLDYEMPGYNGVELLRNIYEEASDRAIVYIWTGKVITAEMHAEAVRAGAEGVLSKHIYHVEHLIVLTTPESPAVQKLLASTTDFLTGLLNPKSFRKRVVKELHGAMKEAGIKAAKPRHPNYFSLICLDMNDLKGVNDQYGHPAGTQTILAVAHKIESQIRDIDLPCRMGGDEFLIWLPGANEEQAAAAKAKVSESVGEIRIELTEAGTILDALSVSAGSATRHKNDLTDPEKDYEGILSEADELMYQEKKRLKGQIE